MHKHIVEVKFLGDKVKYREADNTISIGRCEALREQESADLMPINLVKWNANLG
jgi:hypothetical protein